MPKKTRNPRKQKSGFSVGFPAPAQGVPVPPLCRLDCSACQSFPGMIVCAVFSLRSSVLPLARRPFAGHDGRVPSRGRNGVLSLSLSLSGVHVHVHRIFPPSSLRHAVPPFFSGMPSFPPLFFWHAVVPSVLPFGTHIPAIISIGSRTARCAVCGRSTARTSTNGPRHSS